MCGHIPLAQVFSFSWPLVSIDSAGLCPVFRKTNFQNQPNALSDKVFSLQSRLFVLQAPLDIIKVHGDEINAVMN
jgi:hypothetical protein